MTHLSSTHVVGHVSSSFLLFQNCIHCKDVPHLGATKGQVKGHLSFQILEEMNKIDMHMDFEQTWVKT